MRQLLVRLGLDPSAFNSGLQRATGSWAGFKGEFINIGRAIESFVGNLAASIANRLIGAIASIPRTITGLFEGAINAALSEERLTAQLGLLTGSADEAASIMERLDEWTLRVGADGDQAQAAAGDIAKALRAVNGEVDPDLLFQYMDGLQLLAAFSGRSMGEISEAFGRAITGDVEMLSRALGISREQLAQLSPTFARFIEQSQQAQDAQLGAVTRVLGDTQMQAGDMQQVLAELLAGLGLSQDALGEFGHTAQAEINRFNESLQQLQEELGRELLPILTSVLQEINTLIADNREEIHAFIEGFGDFAADQWVVLADALGRVDWDAVASGGAEFLNSMSEIDWQAIANFINAVIQFMGISPEFDLSHPFQDEQGRGLSERFASGAVGQAAQGNTAPLLTSPLINPQAAIEQIAGQQQVDVHVIFDESLRPQVERITTSKVAEGIGSVVDKMARGGRSRQQ